MLLLLLLGYFVANRMKRLRRGKHKYSMTIFINPLLHRPLQCSAVLQRRHRRHRLDALSSRTQHRKRTIFTDRRDARTCTHTNTNAHADNTHPNSSKISFSYFQLTFLLSYAVTTPSYNSATELKAGHDRPRLVIQRQCVELLKTL